MGTSAWKVICYAHCTADSGNHGQKCILFRPDFVLSLERVCQAKHAIVLHVGPSVDDLPVPSSSGDVVDKY